MPSDDQPSADPVLLATLSGLVALVIGFATLMYWAAQPTVVRNAGVAHFHLEARRATAAANAMLALEEKRAASAVARDLDRGALKRLVREVAQNGSRLVN